MPVTTTRSAATVAVLALCGLFAACGGNSSAPPPPAPPPAPPPPPPPPALGAVTVLSTVCSGGGALTPAACWQLRVDGAGNPALDVEIRLYEPTPPVATIGMVVLGSGGAGQEFYAGLSGGAAVINDLLGRGFRVVDRSWSGGWFASGNSILEQSSRYATLLTWIHDQVHSTGVFLASGTSGGSAEIAYALTAWQRGDILDAVVLSGGPPLTRIDFLCESPASAAWVSVCGTIVPAGVMTCGQPACTPEPSNPLCPLLPATPQPGELEGQSILQTAAVLSFPGTFVHTVLGTDDCTSAVPLGLLFHNAVTSQKTLEFVPAPHLVPETQAGRDAIVQALADAAARAGTSPVRLSAAGAPRVGGYLRLHVRGPAGGTFQVYVGSEQVVGAVPLVGLWQLGPAPVPIASGALDAVNGSAAVSIPIPPDRALEGATWLYQARAGGRLTNLVRVIVQP